MLRHGGTVKRYCVFGAVYGAALVYRLVVIMATGRTFEEAFAFIVQSLVETILVLFMLSAMIRDAIGDTAKTDRLIAETVGKNHERTRAVLSDMDAQIKVLTSGIVGEYQSIGRWLLDNDTEDKARELRAADRHAELVGELLAINGHTGSLDRRLGKLEAREHDHGMTAEEVNQVRREMGIGPVPTYHPSDAYRPEFENLKPPEELGETSLPDRSAELANLLTQYDARVERFKRSATPGEIMRAAHPDRMPMTDDDGMSDPA